MCTHTPAHPPTNRVSPIHVILPTLPCHATLMSVVVNGAVRSASGDSYKTENADDGKAKSRDTRATNCEAGMRDRPANCFILGFLVGVTILGFNIRQFF